MATFQSARSPLSAVFLLHLAIELPLAVQALFTGDKLPLIEMTNTTLVILKMYGALSCATCIAAALCYSLPEFLPGKRAVALGLMIYHAVVASVLLQCPRIVPLSLGAAFEELTLTPERLTGGLHGAVAIGFAAWWQLTLKYAEMVKGIKSG